jgi:hypothetical protein
LCHKENRGYAISSNESNLSETFDVSLEAGLAGGFPEWSGFNNLPGDAADDGV